MATLVETDDVTILIDPAASLAPRRFGLPPHQRELKALEVSWSAIKEGSKMADVIIVTHYHYDHHSPRRDLDIYKDKVVLVKHPNDRINWSQRRRAAHFLGLLKGIPSSLEYADGREFSFGGTSIRFSHPLPHGLNDKLGYVLSVAIDDGEDRFVFTSDVEGAPLEEHLDFILSSEPTILMIDGPQSYMLGFRYSHEDLLKSLANMEAIVRASIPLRDLIVDHHLLRDVSWRERIWNVVESAEKRGIRLFCAAEYLGREVSLLEARRKELYSNERR